VVALTCDRQAADRHADYTTYM